MHLEATTSAGATEFSKDEFGRIRREVEDFRGGLLACYASYNDTADHLSALVGEVTSTAGSVGGVAGDVRDFGGDRQGHRRDRPSGQQCR